jgi:transposase-like protein
MPQLLLPIFPYEATSINHLLGFCRKDDMVYYFNGMMPIFSHHVEDVRSFRLIASQLVENGVASQAEIVRAFGVSKISVKRYVKCYREEGIAGFFSPRRTRSAAVLTSDVLRSVQKSLDNGEEVSSICKELSLKADTVNKAIRDGRLHRAEKKSPHPSQKS